MNAKIEVVTAGASVAMTTMTRVVAVTRGFFAEVVFTAQTVTTSILRVLRQGRSSLTAIPGDVNDFFNGGEAVLVA